MDAESRWAQKVPGYGLWLGVDLSRRVVESGSLAPVADIIAPLHAAGVAPGHLYVKFGGDWGGLWGAPGTWGMLSPRAPVPPAIPIVPYIYVVPQHVDSYRDMVGGLFADGYPAVVLDVEMDWVGHGLQLRQLLQSLNLKDNLIGIAGFAWFTGWPNAKEDFGAAISDLDLVYLPMVYYSFLQTEKSADFNAFDFVTSELSRVVPSLPKAWILDGTAVDLGAVQQLLPTLPPSYWHAGDVTPARFRLLQIPLATEAPSGGLPVGGDYPAIPSLLDQAMNALSKIKSILGGS